MENMATTKTKERRQSVKTEKQNKDSVQKLKSAFTLFREKYPNGVGEIIDMRAVLR